MSPPSSSVVLIPTYDEVRTLPVTVRRLRAAAPDVDVLVIDDDSPDGTGDVAAELGRRDPRIHLLRRASKDGLGAAYLAGFAWALERGYEWIVEMDADGSHPPETLPAMLAEAADGADLVIGSRWVPGGSTQGWPRRRTVLSRGGNTYTALLLDLGVADATAGFRVYAADRLAALDLDSVQSHGYCFQVDMTRRAVRAGWRIVEVPIVFTERVDGYSKMTGDIVREALWRITVWGVQDRVERLRRGRRRG